MKIWASAFNLITGLIMIICAVSYLNFCQIAERDFDQLRYNYAVRQATEAMFTKTLESEDLNVDYEDITYVTINSSEALDTYNKVMCFNYNMSDSKENKEAVQQTMAACVIAGYDGFYIGQTVPIDEVDEKPGTADADQAVLNDGYQMKFSPKIPYVLDTPTMTYTIDTHLNTWMAMSKRDINATPIYNSVASLPPGFTVEKIQSEVNRQIRDAILYEIDNSDNVNLANLEKFRLYFPDDTTKSGVNPIRVPSIFVMTTKAPFASPHKVESMSTSGYRVVKKVNIIGFIDIKTNRPYYCYESQLMEEEKKEAGGSFEIVDYFDSMKEAAGATYNVPGVGEEHYSPYYEIMARKITKE